MTGDDFPHGEPRGYLQAKERKAEREARRQRRQENAA